MSYKIEIEIHHDGIKDVLLLHDMRENGFTVKVLDYDKQKELLKIVDDWYKEAVKEIKLD